jgi:hypothetical protein
VKNDNYKFKLLWHYEKCFNSNETWHKYWLDHSLCNSMLSRKYPVTMEKGGRLKIVRKNNTILHCFFPSKLSSKCCNFSMNWDRVKGFSALVTSYPKIDLRPFLVCHISKIFLAMNMMKGLPQPSPPLPRNRRGISNSGNPLMYNFDWGPRRNSFSNEELCLGHK